MAKPEIIAWQKTGSFCMALTNNYFELTPQIFLDIFYPPGKGKEVATQCPKCNADNPDTKQFCSKRGFCLTPANNSQPSFTRTHKTSVEGLNRGTLFASGTRIIEKLGIGRMVVVDVPHSEGYIL